MGGVAPLLAGKESLVKRARASDTLIRPHVKIQGAASLYDPNWEQCFEERLGRTMKEKRSQQDAAHPLESAGRQVSKLGESIMKETEWNIHHIVEA